MFDAFKSAMDKAETKSDTAVVLGAGVAGFAIDAIASVHGGFSPGTVAGLSAAGALSVKKGFDARRDAKRARRESEEAVREAAGASDRVEKLAKYFADQGYAKGEQELRTQLEWRKLDIIDDAKLDEALITARSNFLAWVGAGRPTSGAGPATVVGPATAAVASRRDAQRRRALEDPTQGL